nr:UDP binding domain-containing protein [uncultured Halovibrio sp.]
MGLGRVGISRAVSLSRDYDTLGFDDDPERVDQLAQGLDATRQVGPPDLVRNRRLGLSCDESSLIGADVYVIAVPSGLDRHSAPDLAGVKQALDRIAPMLTAGNTVIIESTRFPGATENSCIPRLENASGLHCGRDFGVGFVARISTPDDESSFDVIAGTCPKVAADIQHLYGHTVTHSTRRVSAIRSAEATQLVQGAYRDITEAFRNEVTDLLTELDADSVEVFDALGASTDNMPARPNGFPESELHQKESSYLIFAGRTSGMEPQLINRAREANATRSLRVAERIRAQLESNQKAPEEARILIMGYARMANSACCHNTPVTDIIEALEAMRFEVHAWDPWVDRHQAPAPHQRYLLSNPEPGSYDAIMLAVGHRLFLRMGFHEFQALGKPGFSFIDATDQLSPALTDTVL